MCECVWILVEVRAQVCDCRSIDGRDGREHIAAQEHSLGLVVLVIM